MGRRLTSAEPETVTDRLRQAARLVELRKARGFSAYRLAAEAGVSRAHLSRIEAGDRSITTDLRIALADALDVPVEEIRPFRLGAAIPPNPRGLFIPPPPGFAPPPDYEPPGDEPRPPLLPTEPPPGFASPSALRPLSEAAEPHVELPHWGAVGCGQGLELAHPEPELVPERAARGADGWVWARGNSMDAATPAPIPDGSQVFVRKVKRGEPKDGQVVLAHTPNGAVVKRYRASGTTGYLMSETTAHPPPLPIAVGEGVEIQGVVLRVQPPLVDF